jgi:hypothetical protein
MAKPGWIEELTGWAGVSTPTWNLYGLSCGNYSPCLVDSSNKSSAAEPSKKQGRSL